MKAFQGITHPLTSPTWKRAGTQRPKSMFENYGHLKPTRENVDCWQRTLEVCEAMHARVCVIQLPPSFICSKSVITNALKFFSLIRRPISTAIEFRHLSWNENVGLARELIRKADLIHVTDPLKEKPLSEKSLCYYRLHGMGKSLYKYNYTDEDLLKLKERVLENKCEEAYVMFNNLSMRDNALCFRKIMEQVNIN